MKISREITTAIFATLLALMPTVPSAAGGFDSVDDTNNFLANGNSVLTLTGSTKEADFAGAVTAAGNLGVTGSAAFGGQVGIGTTTPQATLDVNGTIKSGSATKGTTCSPEGAIAYDPNEHAPIYCNQKGKWQPVGLQISQKLYQCPENRYTGGGAWASYGCLGQVSVSPTCSNLWWNNGGHSYTLNCTPMD